MPIDQRELAYGMLELTVDILTTALHEIEAYEEQLPYVLVCTDLRSGEQSISGPFATRAEGERILRHESASVGCGSTLVFSVAPLYPALELDGAEADEECRDGLAGSREEAGRA